MILWFRATYRHCRQTLALTVVGSLLSGIAEGQPSGPNATGSVSPDATQAATGSKTAASALVAEIILVGAPGDSRLLTELLENRLAQSRVRPQVSRATVLKEQDLLEPARTSGAGATRIWITQPSQSLARLFFADPRLQRYLMREVPLRSGLDELGRERIAQVVESATLTLLRGGAGMSRIELRRAFRRRVAAPVQRRRGDARSPARTGPEAPPATSLRVGVTYAGRWSGTELGLSHGPGLRVGLERRLQPGSLSATAAFTRDFPQTHSGSEIEVDVQSTAARLLLGGRWPLAAHSAAAASLGGGVSVTRITPRSVPEGWPRVESPRTNLTPWAQAELGLEGDLKPLVVTIAAVAELSLSDTHYDGEHDGVRQRLFTPWLLQPGVLLGAAWR